MTENRLARLEAAADKLEGAVERFECALVGDDLGHRGVLPRLDDAEKQLKRLWFMFPFLVVAGASAGHVLGGWLGV